MIKLGLFSDVHYCSEESMVGTRLCSLSYDKLCKAYEEFEKQQVDLIICLGDLCDVGTINGRKDSIKCMRKIVDKIKSSKIPFAFITGNHDSLCANINDLRQIISAPLAPRSFEMDKYKFICLDANFDSNMNHFSPNGFDWTDSNLPPEQIQFLKQELESSTKECIILIHEPLDSKSQVEYQVNNAKQIREILENSKKVKVVLQGHKHFYEEYTQNNIRYISVNGMCEGKENHFMICCYDDAGLSLQVYDGNDEILKFYK